MKAFLPVLLLVALGGGAAAQSGSEVLTTRSASGQFLVRAQRATLTAVLPPDLTTNLSFIELAPTLLTIASERIRKSLNEELGITAPGRDRIYLDIIPGRPGTDAVTLTAERFRREWVYRVTLPRVVERREFVRAVVNALLLEYANRGAVGRSAELPAWLSEGLTQHLLATRESELMLPPPTMTVRGVSLRTIATEMRKIEPLAAARQNLRTRAPLSIEQLSWPTNEQLAGHDEGVYHHCAQVFVAELLRLKSGPVGLRELLRLLPEYHNWQTAFQRAFSELFANPLALEKWWALQLAHLGGRDPGQLWPPEESWQKLDELLLATIAVRESPGELPRHQTVPLATVIREWEWLPQRRLLQAKLRELELTRWRLAPEFIPLVADYHRALRAYLDRRARTTVSVTNPRAPAPSTRMAVREVLAVLEDLEAQRRAVRPAADSAAPARTEAALAVPQTAGP